jgi:phosphate transport system substrate-binding protein
VEFDVTPIALVAFVFLVNVSNPVEGLDLHQVRGIFSGTIRDWRDFGGTPNRSSRISGTRPPGARCSWSAS